MFKKLKERRLHLIIIAFLIGMFAGINLSNSLSANEPAHRYLDYFHQVYHYIISDYVDEVGNKEIFYGAIRGMMKALHDPYSRFLDENDFNEFKEDITGDFVGVGIEISARDGEIVLISPIEDSPAAKAGIKEGDVIEKVNDVSIKNKSVPDIVKMIRGRSDTTVKMQVRREGFDEPLELTLKRAVIHTSSVAYDMIENSDIGYLRIKIFGDDTTREVEKALKFFTAKGVSNLIVDLRGNPGGKLDDAIQISDFFLEKGKTIVTTKGRKGSGNITEAKSTSDPIYRGKVIVLVNKGSASASEILAGAIKDNNRGKLLGERTFGKGVVQRLFNLTDVIGITLTVAKYYTPSGVSIHGTGILPDIQVSSQIIPEADKKNVNIIVRDKIPELFVKTNRQYNEETKRKFQALLQERNLPVSEASANYILMTEIARYTKRPLYNLEFDTQLKEALKAIHAR